ncbi:hypothetical protein FRC02_000653 [Tulasnella sp. 418]|nr:hypothetical protein FRC02_000653 [Tulasnella sp. 418]
MRFSFTFATALFTLISSVVIAQPTRVLDSRAGIQADSGSETVPYTNAQRFARGLPPIMPARHRGGALRPRASPGLCSNSDVHRGRIKLTTSNGQIRYIKGGTTVASLVTTNDVSQALQVSLIYDGTSPPNYFRIEKRDSFATAPINLGASTRDSSNGGVFTSTISDILLSALVASNPNSINSPAPAAKVTSTIGGNSQWSESVLWSISTDNVLTMTWYNSPPMASAIMIPYIYGTSSTLYYSPSITAANSYLPGGQRVTMQFECLPVLPL